MCEQDYVDIKMDDKTRYQTMVDSGQATLKALLVMNGGGAATLLTFITHVTSKDNIHMQTPMLFVVAISFFITSTFLTVLSYGAIYATNCYSFVDGQEYDGRKRKIWFRLTVVFGYASLGVFVLGCIMAGTALVVNSHAVFGS